LKNAQNIWLRMEGSRCINDSPKEAQRGSPFPRPRPLAVAAGNGRLGGKLVEVGLATLSGTPEILSSVSNPPPNDEVVIAEKWLLFGTAGSGG
jgi:hypothetical protein